MDPGYHTGKSTQEAKNSAYIVEISLGEARLPGSRPLQRLASPCKQHSPLSTFNL